MKRIMLIPKQISSCSECTQVKQVVTDDGVMMRVCSKTGLPAGYITFKACPIWQEVEDDQ
jgi:hypothetical protein